VPKRVLLLLLLLALPLAACSAELDKAEMIEAGEGIYTSNCSRCHQVTGEGSVDFPALAGNPVVTLHNTSSIVDVVLNGRGSMPAFRGALTDEEVAAVLTYIRNAWGNEAELVPPKQAR
jgi:cytochrome c oxidase subunit II